MILKIRFDRTELEDTGFLQEAYISQHHYVILKRQLIKNGDKKLKILY